MITILNYTDDTYMTLQEYVEQLSDNASDTYYVLFLVDIAGLFTAAKKRSAFRARHAKDDKGEPTIDTLVITDEERDLFNYSLERGAPEIFRKLSGWARGVRNAYQYDVTFGASPTDKYIVYASAFSPAWDENLLPAIDNLISETLTASILKDWYLTNRYMQDYEVEETARQDGLTKIKSLFTQMEKTTRLATDWFENTVNPTVISIRMPSAASTVSTGSVRTFKYLSGALTANVLSQHPHSQNFTTYTITLRDMADTNDIQAIIKRPQIGNEGNSIELMVGEDIPEGVIIILIGS